MNGHQIDVLLMLRRWEEARVLVGEALSQQPDAPELWSALGTALSGLDRNDEARGAFERALSLAPDDSFTLAEYGSVLSLSGKHRAAEKAFETAMSLDPNSAGTLVRWVEAILADTRPTKKMGRAEKARPLANQLLSLAPDQAVSHIIDSKVYLAADNPRFARTAAERALAIDPNNPLAHQLYGIASQELGNIKAAGNAFVAAGKADPHSDASRQLIGQLGTGGFVPLGIGAYLAIRVAIKVFSAGGEAAGVPTEVIFAGIAIAVIGGIVFALDRSYKRKKARIEALSPEARAAYDANKKLK